MPPEIPDSITLIAPLAVLALAPLVALIRARRGRPEAEQPAPPPARDTWAGFREARERHPLPPDMQREGEERALAQRPWGGR